MILNEVFNQPTLDSKLRWFNPPPHWAIDSHALVVQPGAPTDFWQQTHYGFRADTGHFLFAEVSGDFTIATKVRFQAKHQYDQAGLMLRNGPFCWLKASVEHEPDRADRLGAV